MENGTAEKLQPRSMEYNLSSSRRSIDRNIDDLMSIVRTL